jgi:hypothetical protein
MVGTLRIELRVGDYDRWRQAFEQDAGGRQRSGARCYRIFRGVEDPNYVMLDLDFDSTKQAEGFLEIMRTEVWPSPEKAPAKLGTPQTRIIEMVESVEY